MGYAKERSFSFDEENRFHLRWRQDATDHEQLLSNQQQEEVESSEGINDSTVAKNLELEDVDQAFLKEMENVEEKTNILTADMFTTTQVFNEISQKNNSIFTCKDPGCGKQFTKLGNIRNHTVKHMNIKPFKCYLCECAYTQKGNLVKHIITKHKIRPAVKKHHQTKQQPKDYYSLKRHAKLGLSNQDNLGWRPRTDTEFYSTHILKRKEER